MSAVHTDRLSPSRCGRSPVSSRKSQTARTGKRSRLPLALAQRLIYCPSHGYTPFPFRLRPRHIRAFLLRWPVRNPAHHGPVPAVIRNATQMRSCLALHTSSHQTHLCEVSAVTVPVCQMGTWRLVLLIAWAVKLCLRKEDSTVSK